MELTWFEEIFECINYRKQIKKLTISQLNRRLSAVMKTPETAWFQLSGNFKT
ncbi:Uncharacterised protein [Streptococcus pneumoniae]|nr:Uncharacterised protein [Streptococcus pneumoniae]